MPSVSSIGEVVKVNNPLAIAITTNLNAKNAAKIRVPFVTVINFSFRSTTSFSPLGDAKNMLSTAVNKIKNNTVFKLDKTLFIGTLDTIDVIKSNKNKEIKP